MMYGDEQESPSLMSTLGMLMRTGHRVGFVRDAVAARWREIPKALPIIVREGVNVRTIHHVNAHLHPDRRAMTDARRQLTFREANEEINRLADTMRTQYSVGRTTPVALSMKNRVEYLLLWMALSRLGASTVHASWRQKTDELAYQLEHSGAKLLFAGESIADAVAGLDDRELRGELDVVGVDDGVGDVDYTEIVDRGSAEFPRREDEDVASDNVVYTSGTTGRPKGAVRNMAAYGLVEFFQILERLPVRTGERHLIVSPMYHSGGQVFAIMQTALGASLYFEPEFDAEKTLKALHDEAINSVFLVPTMLRRILDLPDELHEEYTTPALRGIFCGAAPFPQPLRERAIERFGASVIHDFYGATEIGWITLINGEEMLEKPGSIGRPIAGQRVRIVGDNGEVLPSGETGIIYVNNEHVMSGYLDNEEATEEIIDEGWMTVDDCGYLDEDGYLYLAGRDRDMVISGGVNIYPVEIEEVLAAHPDIRDIAIIGVPHEEWGEALVAIAVVDGEPSADELEEFARQKLSGYKIPKRWEFVDELPRNPTGKVLKRRLEEEFG